MASSLRSCRACRYHVLDAFASSVGVPLRRPLRQPHPNTLALQPAVAPYSTSRTFASTSKMFESNSNHTDLGAQEEAEDVDLPISDVNYANNSIPWYLQVETPEPPPHINTSPILASQEIPPTPTDAPSILEPILNHLSISIGLDNLSLLDLRTYTDPPPALGSNLFMVIGTARSHKHLNTSADRFCRWLRSTYKLRPYADGLLGRNEMKLKLRRKNRRMKSAQSVGNTLAMTEAGAGGKYDDGITTGWICCNLGPIDEVVIPEGSQEDIQKDEVPLSTKEQERITKEEEDEYTNPAEDQFYAGFGHRSDGPKIVVQMFTEEKRLEMDLEGLWGARLQKRTTRNQNLDLRLQRDTDANVEEAEVRK